MDAGVPGFLQSQRVVIRRGLVRHQPVAPHWEWCIGRFEIALAIDIPAQRVADRVEPQLYKVVMLRAQTACPGGTPSPCASSPAFPLPRMHIRAQCMFCASVKCITLICNDWIADPGGTLVATAIAGRRTRHMTTTS
jgi:hypothetical protein